VEIEIHRLDRLGRTIFSISLPQQYLYPRDTPVFFGDFMVERRKYEALYGSNMNYYATYRKGFGDPRVGAIDQTEKGLINIKFRGLEEVSILISPQGTIQIFYTTLGELQASLDFLMEILVPKFGETLCLVPQRTYSLVDKIRYLIQEGEITHDMSLDSKRLVELTGCSNEDIKNNLPTILNEIFPFGIELKVSRIIAGCSRAEPYIEEWLSSVEQALRREGFYSPCLFEWEQNQSFELVKHMCVGANHEVVIRVKAFLDGRIVTEAKPRHLAGLAQRILYAILDKYEIPYETEIPVEMTKSPLTPVVILGLVTLGALVLCGLSNTGSPNPKKL